MADKVSSHTALIYVMVLVSASDSDMTDRELGTIGAIVKTLPAFRDFDSKKLVKTAEACAGLLGRKNGLNQVLALAKRSLSPRLRETAYALACDITAVDGAARQEELRLLELIRDSFGIDRLTAAAIEKGAAVRYRSV